MILFIHLVINYEQRSCDVTHEYRTVLFIDESACLGVFPYRPRRNSVIGAPGRSWRARILLESFLDHLGQSAGALDTREPFGTSKR